MWSIYEIIHICTAVVDEVKSDHRSKFSNLSNWKEEAWKNQGFNGIRTRDLRDTGAMLYQLSYEATHWERGQFIEFIFSRAVRLLLSNCLNWKIYCDDHSSLHLQPQYKYELFHIYFTYELNKLTSLPMCGFIAQLVEHRTGIAEVTGSNPVEALIFSGFFFPIA